LSTGTEEEEEEEKPLRDSREEIVVSERTWENRWPLVGISISVLATFISVIILLWFVLLFVAIP
jgi:hypothetical protein